MAEAARDENNVPTMTGVLNSDGATVTRIKVDVSGPEHIVEVDDNTTGSDNGPTGRALRDENYVPVLIGVSSADGVTPVAVYADSNGKLLIDST